MELGLVSLIREGPADLSWVSFPSPAQSLGVQEGFLGASSPCWQRALSSSWHSPMVLFPIVITSPWLGREELSAVC